jgi:hypothetical protein
MLARGKVARSRVNFLVYERRFFLLRETSPQNLSTVFSFGPNPRLCRLSVNIPLTILLFHFWSRTNIKISSAVQF